MRILFAVHFTKTHLNAADHFFRAWNNFLGHYKKDLKCDVMFCSGNHSPEEMKTLGSNCDLLYTPPNWLVPDKKFGITMEQIYSKGMNVPGGIWAKENGYDFYFRMNHDAFMSPQDINSLCEYIEANPNVDFITTPYNTRNLNATHKEILNIYHRKLTKPTGETYSCCDPYGLPTDSGDLWGLGVDFLMEWCNKYEADPDIFKVGYIGYGGTPVPQPYFHSKWLTYGQICEKLEYSTQGISQEALNGHIIRDGAFGSDCWTHFIQMNPTIAGITGRNGESFEAKNALKHILNYPNATQFSDLVDHTDNSFPYPRNAEIDYLFHMENGYMVHWHFNPFTDKGQIKHAKVGRGFYLAQHAMVKMFCERFGDQDQIDQMNKVLKKVAEQKGEAFDWALANKLDQQVRSVYQEPLSYYLQ